MSCHRPSHQWHGEHGYYWPPTRSGLAYGPYGSPTFARRQGFRRLFPSLPSGSSEAPSQWKTRDDLRQPNGCLNTALFLSSVCQRPICSLSSVCRTPDCFLSSVCRTPDCFLSSVCRTPDCFLSSVCRTLSIVLVHKMTTSVITILPFSLGSRLESDCFIPAEQTTGYNQKIPRTIFKLKLFVVFFGGTSVE